MVVLGMSSGGIVISVNARAAPPYDNSAHPRILPKVFWSTVFSLVDTVPAPVPKRRRCRGSVERLYLHEPVVVVAADPERRRRRRLVDEHRAHVGVGRHPVLPRGSALGIEAPAP